jgi:hypothetical protein
LTQQGLTLVSDNLKQQVNDIIDGSGEGLYFQENELDIRGEG